MNNMNFAEEQAYKSRTDFKKRRTMGEGQFDIYDDVDDIPLTRGISDIIGGRPKNTLAAKSVKGDDPRKDRTDGFEKLG
jgi:hypothetical protein